MGKAKYDSRHALLNKQHVRDRVSKFASGLGETDLLDRYYIRSHFPPRDILTELGDTSSPGLLRKGVPILLAVVIGIFIGRSGMIDNLLPA